MRGSGLSLERFIKGKAQRTRADAKSKKKVIIRKAQRKREYEKVKKREGHQTGGDGNGDDENTSGGPTSFYDKFFNDLKKGKSVDEDDEGVTHLPRGRDREKQQEVAERRHSAKPDPFFKAKKKAEATKMERQKVQQEKQKQREVVEKKVVDRKKRHVKLSMRTASGQPVVKNHITDILARLQAEKK